MPAFLTSHVRYPELLFTVQAMMYSTYHVDNEQVFYNREDVWSLAQQSRGQGSGQTPESIEPLFLLMTFPGESNLEFVSIFTFNPSRRNNMSGWLAGRSDGDAYGKLRAYHLPKSKFVDGPLQIQARIDQDSQLSSQLTLWNQQGSKVIRGNLLVIPIDDVLLFAEPIYLQAERSPMPALRLIVLATQDRLAYAPTFDEALKRLLEGRGGTLSELSVTEERTTERTTPAASGAKSAAGQRWRSHQPRKPGAGGLPKADFGRKTCGGGRQTRRDQESPRRTEPLRRCWKVTNLPYATIC